MRTSRMILSVLVLLASRSASAQNALSNGTFDSNLNNWSTTPNASAVWVSSGATSPGSVEITTIGPTEQCSLWPQGNDAYNPVPIKRLPRGVFQKIPAQPGESFRIRAKSRHNPPSYGPNYGHVWACFETPSFTPCIPLLTANNFTLNSWASMSVDNYGFETPGAGYVTSMTVVLSVCHEGAEVASFNFDDVMLTRATQPPVAVFTWSPATPNAGQAVAFSDQSTGTPKSWSWKFGDGATSTSRTPTHTYAAAGTFNVSLTVTNVAGSHTATKQITAKASTGACTLACSANVPTTATQGASVAFAASATATTCSAATAFQWAFGDGTTSNQQNPSKAYSTKGTYTWTLTVSNGGAVCKKTGSINVTPAPMTLQLLGVEVTQGVQNLHHEAPLIAGRTTVARVFLRSSGAAINDVDLSLKVAPEGGTPSTISVSGVSVPPSSVTLFDLRSSVTAPVVFEIPTDRTNGRVAFEVSAPTHALDCSMAPYGCRAATPTSNVLAFTSMPPLRLKLFDTSWKDLGGRVHTPDDSEREQVAAELEAILPIPRIGGWEYASNTATIDHRPETIADFETILQTLEETWMNECGELCAEIYVGVLPDYGGGVAGLAFRRDEPLADVSHVAASYTLTGNGSPVVAHEVGHSLGRRHTATNCASAGDPDVSYPPSSTGVLGAISPSADPVGAFFGYDVVRTPHVTPPNVTDFMGYCGNSWTGAHSHNQIVTYLERFFSKRGLSSSTSAAGDRLLVSGTIFDNSATIRRVLRSGPGSVAQRAGTHWAKLLTTTGGVLQNVSFTPNDPTEGSNRRSFAVWITGDDRAAHLQIGSGATTLATIQATSNSPAVTVLAPNGGETATQPTEVRWSGSDPDGDQLAYSVFVSTDGGTSWRGVATAVTETSARIDLRSFAPSSRALVRVTASDGLRTAFDVSDGLFTIPNQPPRVSIFRPQREIASPGSDIRLEGDAADGDGALAESSFTWISDRAGTLGTGRMLTISKGVLANGPHLLTLRVTDSSGAVGTATRRLWLGAPRRQSVLNGRFNVDVRYRNHFANPPAGGYLAARSFSASEASETLLFSFDDPTVVEFMVRLSDARPFDNHIHVFYGGLTDIELFITVADALTGKVVQYHKPANVIRGAIDRVSFIAAPSAAGAVGTSLTSIPPAVRAEASTATTLRLLNGRFEVKVGYRNQFANPPSTGFLLGQSIASSSTTETAVFFFDNPQSVEWMVRFSDARPFDPKIHFFHGGLTDVELRIEVFDTVTGTRREYVKAPNSLAGAVDRTSFAAATGVTAAFTWTPSSPTAGQNVQFMDRSTGSPTWWCWTLGNDQGSDVQNPVALYPTPGTYKVWLTAGDRDGQSISTQTIVVGSPSQDASFTWTPTRPLTGQKVQFIDQSRDATFWSWKFGDGTGWVGRNPTHVYAAAGKYRASLVVVTPRGPSRVEHEITVSPSAVSADSHGSDPQERGESSRREDHPAIAAPETPGIRREPE